MLKTAIRHGFFKERWGPMIGTSFIRFRRALLPFTKFQLVSILLIMMKNGFIWNNA